MDSMVMFRILLQLLVLGQIQTTLGEAASGSRLAELQEQIRQQHRAIERVSALQRKAHFLEKRNKRLKRELDELISKYKKMSKVCGEGGSEDQTGDTKNNTLSEKTDTEILSKLKKVEEEIAECRKNQTKMEQQIAELEKQNKKLTEDRKTAEEKIESLEGTYRKCEEECNETEKNYTDCKKEVESLEQQRQERAKKCQSKHDNLVKKWKKKLEEATIERDLCSKDYKEVSEWVKNHKGVKVIFEVLQFPGTLRT